MIGETVTVRRYGTDRYGDRTLNLTFLVPQCAFAPRVTTEDTDRSNQVVADAELYTPSWAGIRPADVVELADTTTWEVQGLPEVWTSPFTTWTPGTVVPLKRTTG